MTIQMVCAVPQPDVRHTHDRRGRSWACGIWRIARQHSNTLAQNLSAFAR
jgi:hypothetical protein